MDDVQYNLQPATRSAQHRTTTHTDNGPRITLVVCFSASHIKVHTNTTQEKDQTESRSEVKAPTSEEPRTRGTRPRAPGPSPGDPGSPRKREPS
jgi:hypothetical protein